MLYLSSFSFPEEDTELNFLMTQKYTCYQSHYPFKILSRIGLRELAFEPVTILCGGNGSGKTTALNVICEALKLERSTLYNRSAFFDQYVKMCDFRLAAQIPDGSCAVASDDVFDFMLDIRQINEGIDVKREELFEEYNDAKYSDFRLSTLDDYMRLKKVNMARRMSKSKYVSTSLMDNIREHSNGESAFRYFIDMMQEGKLYLLDEPENSLSPDKQEELMRYISDSARFFGCQFIIATHSPFILSMEGAKIYDLDEIPVSVKKWTRLENVKVYYEFFMKHSREFEE